MEKAYQHFAHAFLKHFLPQSAQEMPLNKIPEALAPFDKEVAEALSRLKLAEETHAFVKHDMELRTKLRDVWHMQCEQTAAELEQCRETLKKHADRLGITADD